ncbi:MAG: glycosyltransferase family 2 protein [Chitinophagaceae bacterium]|nr:glycosyltransferase family 2 protein [Chitinophagaceae bacterium]
MSSSPSVAIVILNWNGQKMLEEFLPFIFSSTYDNYSVIVADNGSTDNSIPFLKEFYPQVQILKNDVNKGFAKGYNDALKAITAEYYVLLNNDVEAGPGWIEPVIELMQSDTLIAACQPKVLSYVDKNTFEYAGACGGWLDAYGYPFARGRVFDICETDRGQYDTVQQIFWATGACLFIRAEAFHSVGGFDEYFFAHQEEIDLCWRLQLAGNKIFVQPKSVVYHIGGGTLPVGDKRKVYLNFRNNLVMLTKNLPVAQALWKVPFRIGLNKIFALKALFKGNSTAFTAVFKAHFHYLKWLLFEKNKKIPQNKTAKLQGMYKGLVIWQYFIKKKKTFSEIVTTKDNI